jgi:hypothetical protein
MSTAATCRACRASIGNSPAPIASSKRSVLSSIRHGSAGSQRSSNAQLTESLWMRQSASAGDASSGRMADSQRCRSVRARSSLPCFNAYSGAGSFGFCTFRGGSPMIERASSGVASLRSTATASLDTRSTSERLVAERNFSVSS